MSIANGSRSKLDLNLVQQIVRTLDRIALNAAIRFQTTQCLAGSDFGPTTLIDPIFPILGGSELERRSLAFQIALKIEILVTV